MCLAANDRIRILTNRSEPTPKEDAPTTENLNLRETQILDILTLGKLHERGHLPYSSNYAFLVTAQKEGSRLPAVYKPQQGETPLWDFESGTLCLREVAAYVVSSALGWQLVPPTTLRDGKYGIGSVQLYIEHDEHEHYFSIQEDARYTAALRKLALFDFVINNADRKGGHCLAGRDERLWAIDHGICFHTDYKLRTVIWEFAAEEIEAALIDDLTRFQKSLANHQSKVSNRLNQLLTASELTALTQRLQQLLTTKKYPLPLPVRRNFPWPPI